MNSPSTALVTGATSGFGQATALAFAKLGWRVIVTGRREERLRSLADAIGPTCHAVCFDVRDRQAVFERLQQLPPSFDTVDVLVNNAGLALGLDRAPEADMDQWDEMVDTNVKGLMYCTRAVLPGMVSRGRGHIVNVGSIAATTPYPGANVYGATKAFVHQFSKNLRADLLGTPIRVTNIEPGLAETEFSIVRFGGNAERARSVYAGTDPLTPADVAGMIVWVTTLPPHVNVNLIEVMPIAQAWGPPAIHRRSS